MDKQEISMEASLIPSPILQVTRSWARTREEGYTEPKSTCHCNLASRTKYPVWMAGVLPVSQQMLQAPEAIKSLRAVVLLQLVEQLLTLQVTDKFGVQFTEGATIRITQETLEQLNTQKLVKMLREKWAYRSVEGKEREVLPRQLITQPALEK